MPNSKKILITTESREIFVIRANGKSNLQGFCANCAEITGLLTLDEAVSLSGIAALFILRCADAGEVHFLETIGGHLLVCRNSLQNFLTEKGEVK